MGDYWRGGGLEDSSELEGSPPTYSSGEGYGFKAKQQAQRASQSKKSSDDYDFEIEGGDGSDEDISLGGYQPRAAKASSSSGTAAGGGGTMSSVDQRRMSQERRKSTDQRTAEILAASREAARAGSANADAGKVSSSASGAASGKIDEIMEEEPETNNSWKSSWDNLMEGLNSPGSEIASSPPQRPGQGGVTGTGSHAKSAQSPQDTMDASYNSDSMEISASDFQVGADAAKRAKEKTQARQRRQALDEAPHLAKERSAPKVAASPDVNSKRREAAAASAGNRAPSFQISTALSSIQRSGDSLQLSQDGSDSGYIGHGTGGVAASRGDGDLYKMLGGDKNAGSGAGGGRYGKSVNASGDGNGNNISDFSNSGNGARGDTLNSDSDDDDDDISDGSGNSELAQSAEFVENPPRERRSGFSGAATNSNSNNNNGLSSDEYNSEEEQERRRTREAEMALSAEEREEGARIRKMEEIRNRWLNPKPTAGTATGTAGKGEASALDYLEESNDNRAAAAAAAEAEQQAAASSNFNVNDTTAGSSGSDLPQTAADQYIKAEEEALLQQMVDPNPANANAVVTAAATAGSVEGVGSKLITAVGSASMVTSVPPPPPPAMTASEDAMVITHADSPTAQDRPASRTSVLLYSDSSHDNKDRGPMSPGDDASSLGATQDSMAQDSVLHGLHVSATETTAGGGNNRYQASEEDSPERAVDSSNNKGNSSSRSKPDVTQHPAYIQQLTQYQQQPKPVVIAHTLEVGDGRDTLRSGGATAVDAYGRRSAASGSGGQPFLNKVVATEVDPATLGIPPPRHSKQRSSGGGGVLSASGGASRDGAPVGAARPPPPAPTSWPRELPMTNPNTTDLHAHLAMMESSEAKRILAVKAQAAKIRQAKAVNQRQGATTAAAASASKKTAASKGAPNLTPVGSTPVTSAAQNRLEAGTARLARQFEMLEKELKAVKASRASSSNGGASSSDVKIAAGITPAAVGGYVGATPPRAAGSSIPMPASRTNNNTEMDLGIVPPPAPSHSRGGAGPRGSDEKWEGEALSSMRRIVEESDKLDARAKGLSAREEALRVREAMVDLDLRNPNRAGRMAPGKSTQEGGEEEEEHPLVVELRAVEKAQADEIDTLKARCFKLQNAVEELQGSDDEGEDKEGDTGEGNNDSNSKKKKGKAHYSELLKGGATGDEEETITVTRAAWDGLHDEIKSQESLIEGFQRENEKLLGNLRSMESEYNRDKARFFDQRESINRDLNRLRNATGETASEQLAPGVTGSMAGFAQNNRMSQDHGGVRRSAETLREELDAAAAIFNLKEQLAQAESGSGVREKELQKTIERLRQDLRDVQAENAGNSAKTVAALSAEKAEQESRASGLMQEISNLKKKLVWYAENQALIDEVEKGNAEMRAVEAALRKELRRRGMDTPQIQALCTLAMDHRGRAEPPSLASPSDYGDEDSIMSGFGSRATTSRRGGNSSNTGSGHRSQTDVRRIKELESLVEELQDSLRRRNPDSVSNLVRAAAVSEDVQQERREAAEAVDTLREELTAAKDDYDRRLRSLRQEHDRVRLGYEGRIRDLEDASSSSVGVGALGTPAKDSSSDSKSSSPNGSPKTLAAANVRIRELEAETTRVRAFYTKKVEDAQKKAEAQIHAMKRATTPNPPAAGAGDTASGGGDGGNDTDTIAPTGEYAISDADREANMRAELRVEHEAELAGLQKQLQEQAREIGTLRANSRVEALLAASGLMPASAPATPASAPATPAPSREVVEAVKSHYSGDSNVTAGGKKSMSPLAAAIAAEAQTAAAAGSGTDEAAATQRAVDSLLAAAAALSPVPIKTTTAATSTTSATSATGVVVTAEQVRASPLWQAELGAALVAMSSSGSGGAESNNNSSNVAELQRRVREEEARASNLMGEVVQLRTQLLSATNVNAPYPVPPAPAPAAVNNTTQLESMERSIKALEKRLMRRESELLGAIDQSKTAGKMERARLEAIHAAEIREKDEQLVRFQQELEQLVYCLRQWQMEAQSKGSSSAVHGAEGSVFVTGVMPGMPPSPATALMPVL
jgi:hypothetical protein